MAALHIPLAAQVALALVPVLPLLQERPQQPALPLLASALAAGHGGHVRLHPPLDSTGGRWPK